MDTSKSGLAEKCRVEQHQLIECAINLSASVSRVLKDLNDRSRTRSLSSNEIEEIPKVDFRELERVSERLTQLGFEANHFYTIAGDDKIEEVSNETLSLPPTYVHPAVGATRKVGGHRSPS